MCHALQHYRLEYFTIIVAILHKFLDDLQTRSAENIWVLS